MFKPTALKRVIFFTIFDILISLATLYLAFNLRFNFDITDGFLDNFFAIFITITFLKISIQYYKNIYNVAWRFFGLREAHKLLDAHLIAYTIFLIIYYIFADFFNPFSKSVILIDMFLSVIFIGGFRISKRMIIEEDTNRDLEKTMIIGANQYAQTLMKQNSDFYIDAVVDDSEMAVGSYFSNIKVGSFDDIPKIIKSQSIKSVIITKELDQETLKDIYKKLHNANIRNIFISTLTHDDRRLKNLSVEDLLARRPKDLDKKKIESFIKDRVVLVSGAGGSIGSEICRQCEKYGAKKLILLDNSEYNLYSITEEIKEVESQPVMQSVVDRDSLDKTFSRYRPEIVIHAAAYKHVPLVEANIDEGILNNVVGAKNIIDISIKYGVEKFVMISTDKAVRPTNVMGATKRICELYAQNATILKNLLHETKTDIVAVRFGNVLGSSGSVIPKFKSQIESEKNVTVTHPDITRYFMLIPEACELVLQAGAIGRGGEIFILDMGEPVKIVDLAKKMIELSGKRNIEIEFIGLRAGEKLYEELLIDESDTTTEYESITVARATKYDIDKLNRDIEELLVCSDKLAKLKEIVPEFNHKGLKA